MAPCFLILSRVVWAPAGAATARPSASAMNGRLLMFLPEEGSVRPVGLHLSSSGYRVQKQPVLEGLAQVGGGPRREAVAAGLGLVVGGNHDGGQLHAGLLQALQHVQPGHAGHVQVEDHAVGAPLGQRIQERRPGLEGLGLEVRGAEQALQRLADGLFVVDDGDERRVRGHVTGIEPACRPARNWTMVLWTKVLRSVDAQGPGEGDGAGRTPARSAMRISSTSEAAPIFCMMRPRWTLMVFSTVPRSAAMCLLSWPAITCSRTWRSRRVSIASLRSTSPRSARVRRISASRSIAAWTAASS